MFFFFTETCEVDMNLTLKDKSIRAASLCDVQYMKPIPPRASSPLGWWAVQSFLNHCSTSLHGFLSHQNWKAPGKWYNSVSAALFFNRSTRPGTVLFLSQHRLLFRPRPFNYIIEMFFSESLIRVLGTTSNFQLCRLLWLRPVLGNPPRFSAFPWSLIHLCPIPLKHNLP